LNFNIGLPNIIQAALLFAGALFLLDYMLVTASHRLSLSTGRWQYYLLNHLGESSFWNFCIAMNLRFISFLEKSYLNQIKAWALVGALNKRQQLLVCVGGLVGASFLYPLVFLVSNEVALLIAGIASLLILVFGGPRRDFGVGLFLFALALVFLNFFLSTPMDISGLSIPWRIPLLGQVIFIGLSYLVFKTLVPSFVLLSFFLLKEWVVGDDIVYLFIALSCARVLLLFDFRSFQIMRLRNMLNFWIGTLIFQPLIFLTLAKLVSVLDLLPSITNWPGSLLYVAIVFCLYELSILPWFFVSHLSPFSKKEGEIQQGKSEPQKIFSSDMKGGAYSIHFVIYLLRQEFLKLATLTHTTFKLGKEVGVTEGETFYRFKKYCKIIPKVADELSSLCFFIGQQRTYSQQMNEIFSTYQLVTQLEILVKDLEEIVDKVRPDQGAMEFRKNLLRWFNNQLKVFENFYFALVKLEDSRLDLSENDRDEQMALGLEELTDFFGHEKENWALLQTLHRVMDTNLGLKNQLL